MEAVHTKIDNKIIDKHFKNKSPSTPFDHIVYFRNVKLYKMWQLHTNKAKRKKVQDTIPTHTSRPDHPEHDGTQPTYDIN